MIANGLDISRDALQFSSGWLHKFKDRNGIRQQKLDGEASFADEAAIADALLLLRERCSILLKEYITWTRQDFSIGKFFAEKYLKLSYLS
jgi:hypothetical protein